MDPLELGEQDQEQRQEELLQQEPLVVVLVQKRGQVLERALEGVELHLWI
jgi:hypothetical protein